MESPQQGDNLSVISIYFDGDWKYFEEGWKFVGEKASKQVVIKESMMFEELLGLIVDRFNVDRSIHDLKLTHANTTDARLNPCEINSSDDIQAFFMISKLSHVSWGIPICVVVVFSENLMLRATCVDQDASHIGDIALVESEHAGDGVDAFFATGNIQKGQSFNTKEDLKIAMSVHAISHCFQFKVRRSTKTLMLFLCIEKECQWRVKAVRLSDSSLFFISKYISEHTCSLHTRRHHQRQASYKLIAERVKSLYRNNKKGPTPNQISSLMKSVYHMDVSYWKCWKAREAANDLIRGKADVNYYKLPSYVYMLEKVNPGSIARIDHDGQNRFKYMFLAFGASIRGYRVMRKVVTVDGTHLKGKYGGVLLVATAQDANMQIYPIAFAVVNSENDASWDFFFKNLKTFVVDSVDQVFISDRNLSIKKGILANYPQAQHGICIYHLKMNINSKCKLGQIQKMFMMAAKSWRKTECISLYYKICEVRPLIGMYLRDAGLERWARSFFPSKRYDIMTSNNAECVNAILKDAREYPLLALFDEIRTFMSRWFNERREKAKTTMQKQALATPLVQKQIHSKYVEARKLTCITLNAATMEFEVKGGDFDVVVSLVNKSCTCREFDLLEIPCVHAIAATMHIGVNADELVGEYFTPSCWFEAYEETIYPTPDSSEWNIPDNIKILTCNPPIKRKTSGRPKKVRIPSVGEIKRRKCSCCGKHGHNKKTCTNQPSGSGV